MTMSSIISFNGEEKGRMVEVIRAAFSNLLGLTAPCINKSIYEEFV